MTAENRQPELAIAWAKYGDGLGHYRRVCPVCGRTFYAANVEAVYCSEACGRKARNAQRRGWREAAREKVCAWCERPFRGSRKDSLFCSNACRQAAYRERATNCNGLAGGGMVSAHCCKTTETTWKNTVSARMAHQNHTYHR